MEYQETMNVDIENIASKNQQFWISIYEVIDDSYFILVKLFPTTFLKQCKNNQNEPQNIKNEVKVDLKKWLWKMGCMHNGYDPPKGVR